MSFMQRSFFLFLIWIITQPANAGVVLEAGLHGGGDEMVNVVFSSGDSSSIRAGQLLSLSIGAGFDISPSVESRITFGVKADFISASNGDVSFIRYPIDMLVLYKAGNWHIGGGVTYHMSPVLNGSGIASGLRADFDNATGLLGELDWFYGASSYLGFRYTSIDYTVQSTNISVNGNSVGLVVGTIF